MPDEQKKFQKIIDASKEFAQAKDIDLLLEKILSTAKKFANAETGSIYINGDGALRYHHTQNETLQNQVEEKLLYKSSLVPVVSGSVVDYVAKTGEIVTIADAQQLPEDVPYTIERSYGEGNHYQTKSLVIFPLKNAKGKVIGVIQIINPHDDAGEITSISEDEIPFIQLFALGAANAIERAQTTKARIMGILQVLTTLRGTEETTAHFNRVGAFAAEIYEAWAQKNGAPQATIDSQKNTLKMAAMLHDIGKLAIPKTIRSKPGKLNTEEYETMKEHTIKGAQLLLKYTQSEIETVAAQIALTHHERWNGSGYPGHVDPETGQVMPGYEGEPGKPRGKKREEIPVFGRVVAVADFYDALTSNRVHRKAWREIDVLDEIKLGAGTQFDPEMVDAFFSRLDTIRAIAQRYPD